MFEFRPQPKPTFKRGKRSKKQRSEFDEETRERIVEYYAGLCGHCGRRGEHIHHVKPKGSGGRGVYTNGLLLCAACHTRIHMQPDMMEHYKSLFADMYGEDYFLDELDKGEKECLRN